MKKEIEQTLVVRKVKTGSVYKLLFCGLLTGFVLLGLLFGVMGFFGADTVKWNNEPIHGVAALFTSPAISLLVALAFTAFLGTVACFGLWLLSRFHTLSIRVVLAQQAVQADSPDEGGSVA